MLIGMRHSKWLCLIEDFQMNKITKATIVKTVKVLSVGEAVVSSLDIAKIFGKQHKNVLRDISKQIELLNGMHESEGSILSSPIKKYFIENSYISTQGKEVPRYNITRKGFDLLVLGFTGQKAFEYKVWYVDEFHSKQTFISKNIEATYKNKDNPLWIEFREQGKEIHQKLTDAIKEHFADYRFNVEKKNNDGKYYISIANLINKHQGIETPKGVPLVRDTLDARTLIRLEDCEIKVAGLIHKYSKEGHHYKEVFKRVKKDLEL